MPRSDHTGMIDGFSSVQALRRLDGKGNPRVKPPVDSAPEPTPDKPATAGKPASFGHTAMPTRHDIICYSCGYVFVVTGRLDKVICPKCKTQLETGDQHIDGNWTGKVKTVGCVYINSGATVSSSHIVATDIRISGICRNTRLEPTRHLELDSGAQLDLDKLSDKRVVIIEDATLTFDEPLRCRFLTIHGELQADARPEEGGEIRPTGMFRGTLHAPSLIVHDGAGLKAHLHIAPKAAASPSDASSSEPA
jgi:cytoskeletal protein CcmA (bactofilin family)